MPYLKTVLSVDHFSGERSENKGDRKDEERWREK